MVEGGAAYRRPLCLALCSARLIPLPYLVIWSKPCKPTRVTVGLPTHWQAECASPLTSRKSFSYRGPMLGPKSFAPPSWSTHHRHDSISQTDGTNREGRESSHPASQAVMPVQEA